MIPKGRVACACEASACGPVGVSGPETKCDRAVSSLCLLVRMRVVCMRVVSTIRAYEE